MPAVVDSPPVCDADIAVTESEHFPYDLGHFQLSIGLWIGREGVGKRRLQSVVAELLFASCSVAEESRNSLLLSPAAADLWLLLRESARLCVAAPQRCR
jgi:hypothetical protein